MKKKSHRGIAKRVKVTARGHVRAMRAGYQHKRIKKRASRKRQARQGLELTGAARQRIKRLLSS
ncbi:MAG: 50S ribosomal protein L35 [Candidatus Bipolaricaulia bacterium]